MFVWIGLNVERQLLKVKETASVIEDELNFGYHNFALPLHISLKISFEVPNDIFDNVVKDLEEYLSSLSKFSVSIKGIEYENTICWIRMYPNIMLNTIHDKLDELMLEKYNVIPHEYDKDYKFHVTLFMDDDTEKVKKAYEKVKDIRLPMELLINKFDIGNSLDGSFNSYTVLKEIKM
ncbi:MAG: 2'-5' RNA ligase family protein [Gammaproteobacteria bacterium]|nr:2'-5' RNA ligase family protein [Gammaproteobacteria bacterium]